MVLLGSARFHIRMALLWQSSDAAAPIILMQLQILRQIKLRESSAQLLEDTDPRFMPLRATAR